MNVHPSQHNPPFQDIATGGLSLALVRDGRAPMTGVLNMNGNKITGVASGDQPSDVVTNADIADLAVDIGDGAWSINDKSPNWLRRNGALYSSVDYPELASRLPPLPDGIIITTRTSGTINWLYGVSEGSGKYVAVGSGGIVLASNDRISWSPQDAGTTSNLRFTFYGSGFFLAGGDFGSIVKSTDAITWASTAISGVGSLYSGVYTGTAFLSVGVLTGAPKIARSIDANTWSVIDPPGSSLYRGIASNGSVEVIVGDGGAISSSSDDGQTWTSRASGTTTDFNAVGWDSSRDIFIAVGDGGLIRTSPDGVSWTPRTSGTTAVLNTVAAKAAGVVIGGASGTVVLSKNGTSYSPVPTGITSNVLAVLADNNAEFGYLLTGSGGFIGDGSVTAPTQFQVPEDDPVYGWIRAR